MEQEIIEYIIQRFKWFQAHSAGYIIIEYSDSDCGGYVDDRKNTLGYVFHFRLGVVSWASKKQPVVTLSSVEAEYVAATSATCTAIWIRRKLKEMKQEQEDATKIYCDNNS